MIDMNRKERIGVDTLLVKLGEPKVGISRADPGEAGPILVKVVGGKTYEVKADGATSEVTDG
jgi:hypothetical protein